MDFAPFFLDVLNLVKKDPRLKAPIFKTIDRYEAKGVSGAALEDGTLEALTSISKGCKLSLVTMQGEAACKKVMKRLKIEDFFETTFTREDSMERPVQLRMALESIGADDSKSVFVGDRVNDLNAARAEGIRFVMIRKGPDSPPADALYRSLAQFAASLKD